MAVGMAGAFFLDKPPGKALLLAERLKGRTRDRPGRVTLCEYVHYSAQFEIRIDGAPRTYRDRKDYAMEAARFLKSKNPHSMVEVKDLQSGDVTAVAHRPE